MWITVFYRFDFRIIYILHSVLKAKAKKKKAVINLKKTCILFIPTLWHNYLGKNYYYYYSKRIYNINI